MTSVMISTVKKFAASMEDLLKRANRGCFKSLSLVHFKQGYNLFGTLFYQAENIALWFH